MEAGAVDRNGVPHAADGGREAADLRRRHGEIHVGIAAHATFDYLDRPGTGGRRNNGDDLRVRPTHDVGHNTIELYCAGALGCSKTDAIDLDLRTLRSAGRRK